MRYRQPQQRRRTDGIHPADLMQLTLTPTAARDLLQSLQAAREEAQALTRRVPPGTDAEAWLRDYRARTAPVVDLLNGYVERVKHLLA